MPSLKPNGEMSMKIFELVIDGLAFENVNGDTFFIVNDNGRDQIVFIDGADPMRNRIYSVYPDKSGNTQKLFLNFHHCSKSKVGPLQFDITDSITGNDISVMKARRQFYNHPYVKDSTKLHNGIVWKEAEKAFSHLANFSLTKYSALVATNELAALRAL